MSNVDTSNRQREAMERARQPVADALTLVIEAAQVHYARARVRATGTYGEGRVQREAALDRLGRAIEEVKRLR